MMIKIILVVLSRSLILDGRLDQNDLFKINECYLFLIMSELFTEIYRNSTLNKNVSTLVVEYLTDPPVLPFLAELCKKTECIKNKTNIQWHYDKYHKDQVFEIIYDCVMKIYRNDSFDEWRMKWVW